MTYFLGIDVGTSSVKVVILNDSGKVVSKAQKEYSINSPLPGYAEQDPDIWWEKSKLSIKEALEKSRLNGSEISAVGFSGQMHGTVLIGKDKKPLRPAIIWTDKRSVRQCNEIYEIIGRKSFLEIACNPAMPGFMAPTLLWIKENELKVFKRIFKVLLPKDYVRFRLTGEIATDFSDASATLLFDVKRRCWSNKIISELKFPADIFPNILESTDITGEVSVNASKETGLKPGTPVVTGGGDSPVGAVGCGVIEPGVASSNIGTGGQIFTTINEFKLDPKNRIHVFCHAVSGKWCLQGAILSAGLSLRWFRDNFAQMEKVIGSQCNIDPYEILSREAEVAEPGCGGLIFLPYLLGERSPYMDPKARGGFFGLTLQHGRQHFIRAIMEGVTYALRDCLEVFKELGVKIEKVIARGGGSRSNLWRQIQADIFNTVVFKTEIEEDSAFGAAILASVGAGAYSSLKEACKKTVRVTCINEPDRARAKLYEKLYNGIYRNLYHSLRGYWSKI